MTSKPFFTAGTFMGKFHFMGPQTQADYLNEKIAPVIEELSKLRTENEKLKKFCLARCCCKSIPGDQSCSYCEVVYGVREP